MTEPIDGVNLLPYLLGKNANRPHEKLFWSRQRNAALRSGDWKILKTVKRGESKEEWRLFDLSRDISEENDLSDSHPKKLAELKEALSDFQKRVGKSR